MTGRQIFIVFLTRYPFTEYFLMLFAPRHHIGVSTPIDRSTLSKQNCFDKPPDAFTVLLNSLPDGNSRSFPSGGIPSNYTVDLDLISQIDLMGIPNSFDITSLPKIQIALDHITVEPITLKPINMMCT